MEVSRRKFVKGVAAAGVGFAALGISAALPIKRADAQTTGGSAASVIDSKLDVVSKEIVQALRIGDSAALDSIASKNGVKSLRVSAIYRGQSKTNRLVVLRITGQGGSKGDVQFAEHRFGMDELIGDDGKSTVDGDLSERSINAIGKQVDYDGAGNYSSLIEIYPSSSWGQSFDVMLDRMSNYGITGLQPGGGSSDFGRGWMTLSYPNADKALGSTLIALFNGILGSDTRNSKVSSNK